ncbi:hypothetical protein BC835DRAFT_1373054 [Cytidiella melzeri]|nr:hypothetical protein BC835DRAFT_1373054 [Cytidiella melzeri]
MSTRNDNSFDLADESDEDFDWEEVAVPVADPTIAAAVAEEPEEGVGEGPSTAVKPNIEITLHARPKVDDSAKKRAAAVHAARVARLACHKMHTILLLGNASVRNKWLNDDLLKARLLSLAPMDLQNAFAMIHKSRVPEATRRGRMFESAMTRLVEWWYKTFMVLPTGHIRNRTYEDVEKELKAKAAKVSDRKGKGRARDSEDESDDEDAGELIRSEKSLMKHALMRRGSRDVSAQLFTALCRALGIPARLVVSLQSVPWQANVGKPKAAVKKKPKKSNDKGKQKAADDESEMEEVEISSETVTRSAFPGNGQTIGGSSTPMSNGKGKQKAAPVINLRKSRGRKLGSAPLPAKPPRENTPDPTSSAPVFWTEVFSRADARWLPVDPVRFIINKRLIFDPSSAFNTSTGARVENRMVYVVAFEEDGYARDVTPRYALEFGAKTAKMQQGGKGKQDWWERVMAIVRRPYRLNRDDLEDDELHVKQMTEQMPTSMAGFKNHPLYVLERHLKRDEVIYPLVELGKFRGEPVYPRSSVVTLKTAETWMRQGRKVREGCQPMKWVKQHAVTVNKKRAIEMAMADRNGDGLAVAGEDQGPGFSSEKDVMQAMYAENQTELYRPDPILDGKVPKNDFGNIDLYVPSMLPAGGAYVPFKGVAKIARQIGIDVGDAVTGFEFKKRRAFPLITGVVVAAENEEVLLEAYWAAEHEAEEKRRNKRQEQVIKRWQRLVQGLRIRQRLQEQYAGRDASQPLIVEVKQDLQEAGGFLNTADVVVQPYTLPRNVHVVLDPPQLLTGSHVEEAYAGSSKQAEEQDLSGATVSIMPSQVETFDVEDNRELEADLTQATTAALGDRPKTMRELAEAVAAHEQQESDVANAEEIATSSSALPLESTTPATATKRDGSRSNATRRKANNNGKSSIVAIASSVNSTPRRGRKRNYEEVGSEPDDGDCGGDDDGEYYEGRDQDREETNTTKRSRRTSKQQRTPPPPAVPVSDRVLRTRKPKAAA